MYSRQRENAAIATGRMYKELRGSVRHTSEDVVRQTVTRIGGVHDARVNRMPH